MAKNDMVGPPISTQNQEILDKLGDLSEKTNNLEKIVETLQIKFDVWQGTVSGLISNSQTSLDYSTYILAAIGLIVAGGIVYVSRSKVVALKDAKENLAKELINSDEFEEALIKVVRYIDNSKSVERKRLVSEQNTEKNVDSRQLSLLIEKIEKDKEKE